LLRLRGIWRNGGRALRGFFRTTSFCQTIQQTSLLKATRQISPGETTAFPGARGKSEADAGQGVGSNHIFESMFGINRFASNPIFPAGKCVSCKSRQARQFLRDQRFFECMFGINRFVLAFDVCHAADRAATALGSLPSWACLVLSEVIDGLALVLLLSDDFQ
jgi:hypothetical protein